MELRYLGWAGIELSSEGASIVIDPLQDPTAVFGYLPEESRGRVPTITALSSGAVAGLVTHLHRDHADAGALAAALGDEAPVLEPPSAGGEPIENLALAQADAELERSGLERRRMVPWGSTTIGPFMVTAVPAVDGTGDPQVSWLVEAAGRRVLHLGDTMWHGYWWRIAGRCGPIDAVCVPVNGAVVAFPHRQPASEVPAVLTPEQAAGATKILGAATAIPIHSEGYEVAGIYTPARDSTRAFARAASGHGLTVETPEPGQTISL